MKTVLLGLLFMITFGMAEAQVVLTDEVRESIDVRVANGRNPGIVIGIVDEDGLRYYSAGSRSLMAEEPVDEQSVFEIGSISKTFTSILLADKVVRGELALQDPLQHYLPEGVTAPTRGDEQIRLVHLANHTSALPRLPTNFAPAAMANPYADYDETLMFDCLSGYELTRDIGEQYEYSNYAAGLLGHVLALHSGMSYEELLLSKIAQPLGMAATQVNLRADMQAKLAIGHSKGKEVDNWDFTSLAGAGGIRSTAEDMMKYLRANMGLLSSPLYEAMRLSHQNSRPESDSDPMVGLGWHIMPAGKGEIVWHNGGTGGYRAFTGFVRGENKGVVVLTNSDQSVDDIGFHLLNPSAALANITPSIRLEVKKVMDAEGIDAGIARYKKLKEEKPYGYDFNENELNRLGYEYLDAGESEKAMAVLYLNTEVYPKSSVVLEGLGEAYARQGMKEQAVEALTKALELNPGNQGAAKLLEALGLDPTTILKEVVLEPEVLDRYIGEYEFAPGITLTVTREGTQLSAQLTGQSAYPVFPKSEETFYYKVVEARLVFGTGDDGLVNKVTLLQGGRETPGRKL